MLVVYGMWEQGSTGREYEGTFQDDADVLILNRGLVMQMYVFFQTCQMKHF